MREETEGLMRGVVTIGVFCDECVTCDGGNCN